MNEIIDKTERWTMFIIGLLAFACIPGIFLGSLGWGVFFLVTYVALTFPLWKNVPGSEVWMIHDKLSGKEDEGYSMALYLLLKAGLCPLIFPWEKVEIKQSMARDIKIPIQTTIELGSARFLIKGLATMHPDPECLQAYIRSGSGDVNDDNAREVFLIDIFRAPLSTMTNESLRHFTDRRISRHKAVANLLINLIFDKDMAWDGGTDSFKSRLERLLPIGGPTDDEDFRNEILDDRHILVELNDRETRLERDFGVFTGTFNVEDIGDPEIVATARDTGAALDLHTKTAVRMLGGNPEALINKAPNVPTMFENALEEFISVNQVAIDLLIGNRIQPETKTVTRTVDEKKFDITDAAAAALARAFDRQNP